MRTYPAPEVRADPVGKAQAALTAPEGRARRILLHFDVDVILSTELPLGDFPHFNAGLGIDQAMQCVSVFSATPALAGLVITEVNPDHDPEGGLVSKFISGLTEVGFRRRVAQDVRASNIR
jgi:arginase